MVKAHYVAKGPNVWSQLEPLICKCLDKAKNAIPILKRIVEPVKRILCADTEHIIPPQSHLRLSNEIRLFIQQEGASESTESSTVDEQSQERFIDTIFSSLGGRALDSELEVEPAATGSPLSKPKVLCIDDDPELLNSLKLRLEQHGIEVNQASRGMEGYLDAFLSEMQVIILDYEMPSENGVYTLRRLKENPVTSDVPVIVLTGRKDRVLEKTLCNMGAAKYLTKPVDWDKLIGELQRHIPVAPQTVSL